jgi:hypothetical protein
MGRPPLGDHVLTHAERQARYRQRLQPLAERVAQLEQRVAALEIAADPELAALLGGAQPGVAG